MTLHTLKYYIDEAEDMIDNDKDRDEKFNAMDDYDRVEWKRPPEFDGVQWFHDMPSTGPHDALNTGARVLSTVQPKPTFYPLDNTPESRARSSLIEKILSWHYWLAARRTVNNVTWDIVMSALKYDAVSLQVVYLPWQRKISKAKKGMWGQSGDFAIIPHNPRTVHVGRTSYGVECVLLCKQVTVSEVVKSWGEKAQAVVTLAEEEEIDEVMLYDYTDDENRVVWCTLTAEKENKSSTAGNAVGRASLEEPTAGRRIRHDRATSQEAIEIIRQPHKLPFLPWVTRYGGTNLESDSVHQYRPLLDPIYLSDAYNTTAIVRSLRISLVIAHAAFPRTKSTTLDGKTPAIDYTQPGGNVPLKQGESIEPMQPPPFDPAINEIDNELEQSMASATVPKLLQDPNVPSGSAFASINTLLRQASTVLDPYKGLAENALADLFTQMLYWIIYAKKPLMAWDTTKGGRMDTAALPSSTMPQDMGTYGNQMVLSHDEIDPENIYLSVKLTATMAQDDLAKLNAAMLMKQLQVSQNRVLEKLDITDPDVNLSEWTEEQLTQAEIQKALKIIGAEGDAAAQEIVGQVQQKLQQQAQQAQQQQQQDAAAQAQAQQQAQGAPMGMGGAPGTPQEAMQQSLARSAAGIPPSEQLAALGIMTQSAQKQLGFNPAMGGTPPAQLAPGVTREAVQGGGTPGAGQ